MPRSGSSYGRTFGQVIHNAIERWLKADNTGRDPETGHAVDLYPEGWQYDEDHAAITQEDEQLVKDLIALAIRDGVLQRLPNREVEKSFTVPLIEGVDVTGRIDLTYPGVIVDHKSTGNMRYAKSGGRPKIEDLRQAVEEAHTPEARRNAEFALGAYQQKPSSNRLADDLQMLLYACVEGATTLRHNVFCRDGRVKKKVVNVSEDHIKDHWEGLRETAREMKALREQGLDEEDWRGVSGPDDYSECNAYGGCRFISICHKNESPTKFRNRYKRLQMAKEESMPVRKGLVILHNCVPEKGVTNTITVADCLRFVVEEVAGDTLETYYSKNAFERRDAIRALAKEAVTKLGTKTLVARSSMDPDEKALVAALSPYSVQEFSARGA